MSGELDKKSPVYTTSSAILSSLLNLGITHAFVNWGSDHPALLEDLARQRQASPGSEHDLKIITCPNEMVALSAAQGYAQVSMSFGKQTIAAVLVHVDVGTQALSCAVHNADRSRVPVLIYAGAAPYTTEGEVKGSRNEFIMWLQDVPDQAAIVRQYMRYTAQIHSGKNTAQVVRRAVQIALSEPKGPTYLWAKREVTEDVVDEETMNACKNIAMVGTGSVEPMALSSHAVDTITRALVTADSPLIITSYLGRNPNAVPLLSQLSTLLAIPVYLSCPWTVSFPRSHPNLAGCSFGMGENIWLREADVVLVLDCDVPWIPMHNRPRDDARVLCIDVDPLKGGMGMAGVEAEMTCRADGEVALKQIVVAVQTVKEHAVLTSASSTESSELASRISTRAALLEENHARLASSLTASETTFPSDGSFTVPNLLRVLREATPSNTLFLNESISNYPLTWNHLQPDRPGGMIASGSSALGWGLGAAIGVGLAIRETEMKSKSNLKTDLKASRGGNASKGHSDIDFTHGAEGSDTRTPELTVLVVGDGSFLFGAPSSAYWISRRYQTPFLTIVLNNGGWKSPKLSLLGVYPSGHGSQLMGNDLTVGFGPSPPDYVGIAAASGGAWGRKIDRASQLQDAIRDAIRVVLDEKRCAVLDCVVEGI